MREYLVGLTAFSASIKGIGGLGFDDQLGNIAIFVFAA